MLSEEASALVFQLYYFALTGQSFIAPPYLQHTMTQAVGGIQKRASRLSFNDVIKKLAAQKEDAPTFLSRKASGLRHWAPLLLGKPQQCQCVHRNCCLQRKCAGARQVPAVERFVVVHGQIILNQFKHLPSKAIKASAFPSALRSALELRRHLKLYASAAQTTSRVNRNPMKVPVHVGPPAKICQHCSTINPLTSLPPTTGFHCMTPPLLCCRTAQAPID